MHDNLSTLTSLEVSEEEFVEPHLSLHLEVVIQEQCECPQQVVFL